MIGLFNLCSDVSSYLLTYSLNTFLDINCIEKIAQTDDHWRLRFLLIKIVPDLVVLFQKATLGFDRS